MKRRLLALLNQIEIKHIPSEIRDNLSLNLFEENISKAREEFFEDLDDSQIENHEEVRKNLEISIEILILNFINQNLYYLLMKDMRGKDY